MSATTSNQNQQIVPISKLWWVGLVAAAGAAIANLILFLVTKGLGIPYILPLQSSDLEALPAIMVIMASVVPAIGATILLAILGKFLAKPIRIFWIIAGVFLVISLVPPLTLPATVALSTKIGLALMHIIAGAVIVGTLSTLGQEK